MSGIGPIGPRSAAVITATTPGSARAALVSRERIRAWACGLRTSTRWRTPATPRSSTNLPRPVMSVRSSRRRIGFPTQLPDLVSASITSSLGMSAPRPAGPQPRDGLRRDYSCGATTMDGSPRARAGYRQGPGSRCNRGRPSRSARDAGRRDSRRAPRRFSDLPRRPRRRDGSCRADASPAPDRPARGPAGGTGRTRRPRGAGAPGRPCASRPSSRAPRCRSAPRARGRRRPRRSDRAASLSRRGEPIERPRGGAAHDVVVVVERPGQGADGAPIAAVAEDERRVAQEPGALRARQRGAAEPRAERLVVEVEQRLERAERGRRFERGVVPGRRLAVPGTHVLAHVAAEQPLADSSAKLTGQVAAVLDGQVRDASPGVEDVRLYERAGRAGVEARGAGAAPIGLALVEGQRGGREDDADEEVRAERRGEEVGALADPAQARARREVALEDRARVDGRAARDVAARGFSDVFAEGDEARLEHVVVVAPACGARNFW